MPKLDVGVGSEFPAEEHRHVHHHHFHGCGPRRPFRLLRLVLSILLIVFVVRLVGFAWRAPEWLAPYDAPMPHALYGLGGVALAIAVIAAILWLLQRTERS
ncbi:MAG TPA: hypothetical protein VHM27_08575 [Rhizomicrobium sp.]|jgi:hypothetical protein|nr:hypothetical protein [Rhizomicrobium sp.]